jgi:Transposase IS116/IS110/IS902 family
VVEALEGLRGGPCPLAVTMGAERGDLTRIETPRQGLQDRGVIPAEDARGARRRPGAITNAGHPPARRALVAGAWAARSPAQGSRHLPRRLEQRPQPSQDRRWQAHGRLGTRVRRLRARGQHAHQVVVALARDLAGFRWAMAQSVRVTREGHQTPPSGPITQEGAPRPSAAAPPRCGAPLDGVTRPAGARVPRVRPAPDGGTSGGRPPMEISVINRRM